GEGEPEPGVKPNTDPHRAHRTTGAVNMNPSNRAPIAIGISFDPPIVGTRTAHHLSGLAGCSGDQAVRPRGQLARIATGREAISHVSDGADVAAAVPHLSADAADERVDVAAGEGRRVSPGVVADRVPGLDGVRMVE